MNVGLVWATTDRLTDITVRYERYVRGFEALGHRVITVCPSSTAVGYQHPVHTVNSVSDLRDPALWRGLNLDVAVVIAWLRIPDLIRAMKAGCAWVTSVADSDGLIGVRVHPRAMFRRMVYQQVSFADQLRAAGFWGRMYLFGPGQYDRPVLDSASYTDQIAAGATRIADNLRRFFYHYSRPDLASKVMVAPYPIDPPFLGGSVTVERANQVVAIGRWDDPQKDAGLLSKTVDRYLATGGLTTFVFIGRGGERKLVPLARRWPGKIRCLGQQPPEVVAECLARSRSLLLPSRWEGSPVVMNEALASGCTVVGTDAIPALISICDEGEFGAVSRGRSAARLLNALRSEMNAWQAGERNPEAIAAHWRPRFDPVNVCRAMLPRMPDIPSSHPVSPGVDEEIRS